MIVADKNSFCCSVFSKFFMFFSFRKQLKWATMPAQHSSIKPLPGKTLAITFYYGCTRVLCTCFLNVLLCLCNITYLGQNLGKTWNIERRKFLFIFCLFLQSQICKKMYAVLTHDCSQCYILSCPILHWNYGAFVTVKLSLAEHESQMKTRSGRL